MENGCLIKNVAILACLSILFIQFELNAQQTAGKYTVYVDFSRSINEPRFKVTCNATKQVIIYTTCAHARKSGEAFAIKFSNVIGSEKSSLCRYRIGEKYVGVFGKAIRLDGLDPTNSNARARAIVIHSSDKMQTKWSWGCFAIPEKALQKLYSLDIKGSILYAYN